MAEQQSMDERIRDERIRDYRQAQRTAMGKTLAGAYDIGQGMDPKSQASMTYRHFGGPEMSEAEREQLMLQYTQLASELQQSTQRLQTRGSRTTRAEVGETDKTWGKLIDLMEGALSPQAVVASKKIGAAQAKRDHHLKTVESTRAANPVFAAIDGLEKDPRGELAHLERMWVEQPNEAAAEVARVLEGADIATSAAFMQLLGNRLANGGHLTIPPGTPPREALFRETYAKLGGGAAEEDNIEAARFKADYNKSEGVLAEAMAKLKAAQEEADAAEADIQRHSVGVDAESRELLSVLTQQKIARAKLKTGVMDKLAAGEEVDPTVLQFIGESAQTVAGPGLTPMEITEGKPEQPYDYMKIALDRLAINPDDRSLSGMRQEMMESAGFKQYMADREFQDEDFAFREMMREFNKKRRQTVRSDRLKARQSRIQERGEGIADQMIGVEPVDTPTRAKAARAADTDELGDPIFKEPRRGAEVTLGGRDVADRDRPSIRERIRTRVADRLRGKQEAAGIQPTYEGTLPGLIGEDLELADLPEGETPVEELGEAEQRERAAMQTFEDLDLEMLDPDAALSEEEKAMIAFEPIPSEARKEGRRGEAALEEDLLAESEFIAPADVKFDKALAARDAAERLGAVDAPADPEIPDTEFVGVEEGGEEDVFEAEQAEKKKLWGSPEEEAAPEQAPSELAPSEEEVEGIDIDAADVWDFPVKGSIEDIDVGSSSIPAIENKKRKALWESFQTTGEDTPEEEPEEEIEEADEETPSVGAALQSPPGLSQADLEEPAAPSSPGGSPDRDSLTRARNKAIQESLGL